MNNSPKHTQFCFFLPSFLFHIKRLSLSIIAWLLLKYLHLRLSQTLENQPFNSIKPKHTNRVAKPEMNWPAEEDKSKTNPPISFPINQWIKYQAIFEIINLRLSNPSLDDSQLKLYFMIFYEESTCWQEFDFSLHLPFPPTQPSSFWTNNHIPQLRILLINPPEMK